MQGQTPNALVLCILTCFRVLCTLKSWLKHFFSRQFWGTPSGCQTAFACWPALKSSLKHRFFQTFLYFFLFQVKNHCKMFEMNKKDWKRPKKVLFTSFRGHAAPKSWSKYTTFWAYLSYHIFPLRILHNTDNKSVLYNFSKLIVVL